jgi:TRAP-type C4-dicarboxylate transport system substrate-binding protein
MLKYLTASFAMSLLLIFCLTKAAPAQESLIFATTIPPNMNVSVDVFHPWAERINQAAHGAVTIAPRDDRVLSDVVQIGWGLMGSIGGKFQRSTVVSLPFEVDQAHSGSAAFWRLYQTGLLAEDFKDIVPLVLLALPQNALHLRKAPSTPSDLRGLKLASATKIGTDAIARVGASPLSFVTAEFYESLQRSLVDGVVTPFTAVGPFKLFEVTSYSVDTAFGGSQAFIFMSRKRYNALSVEARKAIDDNSGEKESASWGAYWDKLEEDGRQIFRSDPKKTLVTPTKEQTAIWRSEVAPITEEWVKTTPNGAKILETYRMLLEQAKAGK